MNNIKEDQILLTIIADKQSVLDLYSEIILNENFPIGDKILIEDLTNTLLENKDIVLIDISSKENLFLLEEFSFNINSRLIFITPFALNNNIFTGYKYFFNIQKPINIQQLIRVIQSSVVDIKKFKYLNTRKEILVGAAEDSQFRIAVYNLEGILIYANMKYLLANKLDDLSKEIAFSDITNCSIAFHDILNQLKNSDTLEKVSKQDSYWFRSYFYFIEHKTFIVHVCIDITFEKNQLINLKREALFFENTNEGLAIIDKKGFILSINESFSKITGYTMDEAIGKPIHILNSGMHTKDFYQHMWDALKYHGKWQGEIWNRRKNSEVYPEWLSITSSKDPVTQEINYLALFTDISSIKEADQKIKFYANHDALTGLLNRNQFENMLQHTINSASRNNKIFALLFVDLDHFKEINDSFGHNVGDILLKSVASLFQRILRKEDIIARIGGDEFNIILENIKNEEDVLKVAHNLIEAIKEPIVIENHFCYISLSIGVALYPKDGMDKITLTKNADSAMYEVKNNGRNGVMLYHSKLTDDLLKKVSLQTDLKNAITNDEIVPYYQPIFDIKTGTITGCEVLARWFHKTRGFVPPDEFIVVAENCSLIGSLDTQLTKKVFYEMANILRVSNNFQFVVAINVSSKEFFSDNYVENIFSLTQEFNLDPSNIELEITETHVMKNHEFAIEKLQKLKALGFKLAIDDFGTGYSSLNYLKLFPINKLKIDKSFILNINENKKDEAIAKTIINLSQFFELEVQAEGVENEQIKDLLIELECNYLQGYYYAKPLPFNEFLDYIRKFNGV